MSQPLTIPLRRSVFNLPKPSLTRFSRPAIHQSPLYKPLLPSFFSTSTPTMAPIPQTMKAVQIPKNGGVEVLEYKDIPVPTLADGQVLVRNAYAGINYIDTYFRTGLYKTPQFPITLGREGAGEVIAVSNSVSGVKVGDRVVFMGTVGSYAQYSAVPAKDVITIPEGLSTENAVAGYLQGLTAWTFIREAGQVKPGQWVLVHAAAGGVGTLLVQMLRAVGAKIIGTAGSEEKCALAKKNGAGWTVNSHEDVAAKVKEITGGHGVDVIFDGVGKATFDADLEMIALKGHLISYGNASGAVPPVNILTLGPKNVKLMRPFVNGYVADRADLEKYTTELFNLLKSDKVDVAIHKVYPLKDVAQAHSDLEGRRTSGKLILKID
ncbi:Fc.00g080770.m01.CDS01 [Cosmosporella sp. VM-42]